MAPKTKTKQTKSKNDNSTPKSPEFIENELNARRQLQAKSISNNQTKENYPQETENISQRLGFFTQRSAQQPEQTEQAESEQIDQKPAQDDQISQEESRNSRLEELKKPSEMEQENQLAQTKNSKPEEKDGQGALKDLVKKGADTAETQIKAQIKKQAWKYVLGFIIASLPYIIIGFVLGLIIFTAVMVYQCFDQKGLLGKAKTIFWDDYTTTLNEAMTGKCISSDSGAGANAAAATANQTPKEANTSGSNTEGPKLSPAAKNEP